METATTLTSSLATMFLQVAQGESASENLVTGGRPPNRTDAAHLHRLVQCAHSVERLKDTSWYAHLPPQPDVQLGPSTFAAVLLRLYENASTGVLIARNAHGQRRAVAFASGSAVAVASDVSRLKLAAYLVESGRLSRAQAERAAQLMLEEDKPLGWALLHSGMLSVQQLLGAQQAYAEAALRDLMAWLDGSVSFHPTGAAQELHRVLDAPTLAMLRQSYAHVHRHSLEVLREVTAPLFARPDKLRWQQPSERALALVEGALPLVTEHARRNELPRTLAAAIDHLEPSEQVAALADTYLLTAYGYLGLATPEFHIRLDNLPGTFDEDAQFDPMARYRQQQVKVAAAKAALRNFNPTQAVATLQPVVADNARRPSAASTEAWCYSAIALALTEDAPGAAAQAHKALQQKPRDALAHAAMARAMTAAGNLSQAVYHEKTALGLSQNDPAWYAEIQFALGVVAEPAAAQRQQVPREGQGLVLWVCAVVVMLSLFALAMVFRQGSREYFYAGDDAFFYVRRLLLLAAGVAGACFWQGVSPVAWWRSLAWRVPASLWRGALTYGLLIGLCSPHQRVSGTAAVVLGLSLLHVVSEALFFHGFITRMLLDDLPDRRLAIVLSACIYGLYHSTYYSFWVESGWQPRLYYIGVIALFAGVPYAWFYARSRSLTAPLVCHAGVSLAMMSLSLSRRANFFGLLG